MPLTKTAARAKDKRSKIGELQHRHFATIAALISKCRDSALRDEMAQYMGNSLRLTNPRFDRARFIAACKESTE